MNKAYKKMYDYKNTLFVTWILIFMMSCQPTQQTVTKVVYVIPDVKSPKNIILFIGDGMGLTQISAIHYKNKQKSSFSRFPVVGIQTCHSLDKLITDSAASATAMACGKKTNNSKIGLDAEGNALTSILDIAEAHDMATGIVVTSSIVHATPAAFYSHQENRGFSEQIASDLASKEIDYIVGGGMNHFTNRHSDHRNLIDEMKKKSYIVHDYRNTELKDPGLDPSYNYLYFTADDDPLKRTEGRDYFEEACVNGVTFLENHSDEGFVLIVEGSQIDWAGHHKDPYWMLAELKEFDATVQTILDYALENKETLVLVTADHETGGLSLSKGNLNGRVQLEFAQKLHTGTMVPVYAFGPGSQTFGGTYDNTDIFYKMKSLIEDSKR